MDTSMTFALVEGGFWARSGLFVQEKVGHPHIESENGRKLLRHRHSEEGRSLI